MCDFMCLCELVRVCVIVCALFVCWCVGVRWYVFVCVFGCEGLLSCFESCV